MLNFFGWCYFFSEAYQQIDEGKCGKWMYFFSDQAFAEQICEKAVDSNICYVCKCTDMQLTRKKSGVLCFYLDGYDDKSHKRVIQFMLDNDLIQRTKTGKYYNISFKFDSQTKANEYGSDFKEKIRLSDFIDLSTGEWIR